MSILIDGVDMPKPGHCKVVIIYNDGDVADYYSRDKLGFAIPLYPHGDLIDKDTLDIYRREEQAWKDYEQDLDNEYLEGVKYGLHEAAKQLSISPVIVKAEGQEA